MAKIEYPLLQVIEVKQRRVDAAEKILKEKLEILKREENKLKEREEARDKVLKHHNDKLAQMRSAMESETTTQKIQQMKAYLKVVKEQLKTEEKKVKDQQQQVEMANKAVEEARHDLNQKRLEVDKIQSHKVDWQKEMRKEEEVIEGREQDELGNIIYSRRHFNK